LVVVEGSPKASRLLRIAVPLSDQQQEVLPDLRDRLGFTGSVKRAGAGRWVPATHVASVERWLRSLEGGESVTEANPAEPVAAAHGGRDTDYLEFNGSARGRRC
jgi:hypothetical protein